MTKNKNLATDIIDVVREGTKRWTSTKKSEDRSPSSRSFRRVRMTREKTTGFKEAAAEIMEKAYLKVSDDDKLPANARQIMYAARPHIQAVTGKPLVSSYFTQTLLPDYMAENNVAWDVVYDARGHFNEPHGGRRFGLGHIEVREYLEDLHAPLIDDAGISRASVKIIGPSENFNALLFVEKEGFDPLLEATDVVNRHDIASMSTKGMSVTAARELADTICYEYDIPLLALHDFDKTGFSIKATVSRDSRRYEFKNQIETIDLGLTLDDVNDEKLDFEHQYHAKGNKSAFIENLRRNGATQKEIEFMFQDFDRIGPHAASN